MWLWGFATGCPGPVSPDVVSPYLDGAIDVAGDAPTGPLCADDEALDLEFDKGLGIDCIAVRRAISQRRTTAQELQIERARLALRARSRRCCVSRQQLIEHMRMHPDHGLPINQGTQRNVDIILGSMLCDRMSREIQTQHYASAHPACLFSMQSNDQIGVNVDGGDQ